VHTKVKRAISLSLAVVFLAASSLAIDPLTTMRRRYDLSNEPLEGLSPELALATQMLGWARGIIIDVVWIRMEALKEQGRYFELVQLADWACKLAPRIPDVWDVQAWNLAYNVSCQFDQFPDRWAWVRSGIELLRDQGIPNNPNSPKLYRSLAWTIWHKMGMQDDYAYPFYRKRWGLLMHEALGGSGTREQLQRMVQAPTSRQQLLLDPAVRQLVLACQEKGFDIVDEFFLWADEPDKVAAPVRQLLEKETVAEPLAKIEAYARSKKLREQYKMDPQLMINLMDEYGPFDWRSPYPHSIYWAELGLEKLQKLEERMNATIEKFDLETPHVRHFQDIRYRDTENLYDYDRVQLDRLIYASMNALVKHGRLLFDRKGELLMTMGPDYRFADGARKLYEKALNSWGKRYKEGIVSAYTYFLSDGVVEFHFMGDNKKSHDYFELLKAKFPLAVGDRSYDQYLEWRIKDYTSSMTYDQVRRIVNGLIVRGYICLGYGYDDKAEVLRKEAQAIAQNFDPEEKDNLRGLIRYDKIKDAALIDVLSGQVGLSADALDYLKQRLGPKKVEDIMRKVNAAGKKGLPSAEKVDKALQKNPDVRPDNY